MSNEILIDINLEIPEPELPVPPEPPSGGGSPVIAGYDPVTRTLSGTGFGSEQGDALVFDRILDDYVPVGVLSWSDTEIVLDSDWDTKDGDTAVKIVSVAGSERLESFGFCIPYTAPFTGFCRITYKSGIDHAIRQGELDSSQFSSLVTVITQTGTATLNGEVVNIKGQTIGFEFGSLFNLTSIGSSFLYYCITFNQPLSIPSSVTSIGNGFLQYCYAFNQPLSIPSSVTSIGSNFLQNCYAFNQPLSIPSSLTSIGSNFLQYCYAFNQPLSIPSGVTSIGSGFLYYCITFNQPLSIPSSVTSIGSSFLQYCYAFNQPLSIPSSVTSIGSSFLQNCYAFNSLTTETASPPTDINSLSQNQNINNPMYIIGVMVRGSQHAAWLAALPNRTEMPWRRLIDGSEV